MQDAIKKFEKIYKFKYCKIFVNYRSTSPLRNSSDIKGDILLKNNLLVSAHEAQHNPYFSILEKKENFSNYVNQIKMNLVQGNQLQRLLKKHNYLDLF